MSPKSAIVLSAGFGKRMGELTKTIPKPLIKLNRKPLIGHVLDRLAAAEVDTAVINVHYLADKLERYLEQREKPAIVISDERGQILDTGGGVKNALSLLNSGPFFIHNSDSVWIEGPGSNLVSMGKIWDPEKMDFLMLMAPTSTSIGYSGGGDFFMASDGQLKRRKQSEVAPFVFTGVSISKKEVFADSPKGAFSLNKLWDRAIENGRLYGIRHEGLWMHVGSPDALEQAERCFRGED